MFHGLFIDSFAGGGGASTGIAQAIGRDVDIAINHDQHAIAVHSANHPDTEHHCQDIWQVIPIEVTKAQHVAGAWFSPDCKEHSKAKGGPVKDRNIRELAWTVPHWLESVRPDVFYLENVEEFQKWGPLIQKADGKWHIDPARIGWEFKRWCRAIRKLGYKISFRELRACDYGAPTSRKRLYVIGRRDGEAITWPKPSHGHRDSWGVKHGLRLPYHTAAECIDWDIPCPSIFLSPEEAKVWGCKRPLVDNTLHRVAHGVMRYVVNNKRPFIVPITHSGSPTRVHDVLDPTRTITTANGGELTAVDATLAPFGTKFHSGSIGYDLRDEAPTVTSNGHQAKRGDMGGATPLGMVTAHLEKFNADTRPRPVTEPLDTVMAGAARHAVIAGSLVKVSHSYADKNGPRPARGGFVADAPLPTTMTTNNTAQVSAFLSSFHPSNTNGGQGDPTQPHKTTMAGGQHSAIVCAHMEQANTGEVGHEMLKPTSTIVGKGSTQRLVETTMIPEDSLPPEMMRKAEIVAAFLVKYFGTGKSKGLDEPMGTVTTLPRFAVVTVTIDAVTYVIVDIGLRMLTPRELARAQGFPEEYILDPACWQMKRGKRVWQKLTKADQIRMIGNSVCPAVARALVRANQPGANDNWVDRQQERRKAA